MRILCLLPFAPRFDSPHGGRATAEFLIRLAHRNDVALLCLRPSGEPPTAETLSETCAFVEEVELRRPPRRLRRLWSLMARGLPLQADDVVSDAYAARVREVAETFRPDVVHVEPRVMAPYLERLEGGTPKVLVEHEPVVQTARAIAQHARGFGRVVRFLDLLAWLRFERRTTKLVHAIVALTEEDRNAIGRSAQGRPVTRIPLGVEIPERPLDPLGSLPPSLLFVGGYGHPPNVDAALRLARSILPPVHESVPDAVLYLVGDGPPRAIAELAERRVVVPGRVADVRPYLERAAVVVAPVRFGGGMRNKVLEALAAGKAVVASPLAAAGLDVTDGGQLLLAEDDDAFAHAVTALLESPERRRELGERGRAWAEANLAWDDRVIAFESLYRTLLE